MSNIELLRKAFNLGAVETLPKKPDISKYNSLDYAIWRFLHAWRESGELKADHAVLLRQIVRWSGFDDFFFGKIPLDFQALVKKAGIRITTTGDLTAKSFSPEWLWKNFVNAESNIDGVPKERRPVEDVAGESFLQILGYKHWHSQAQKDAAWLSLNSPPNSTTLIALPTGSGKSLCFQLLSRFSSGLTVVVVPTIALAIDQWQSARERLKEIPDIKPLYYAANDSLMIPENVVNDVKERRTRLIFTSPEACVSGRLRIALEDAARDGFLENFVVDEAHIIESWGSFFRVDFQMLSMLREKWSELSNRSLRTFLLSATFTPNSRETLKELFGTNGQWQEFICQRLRPEMTYYTNLFSNDDAQMSALAECAWRLPRPAIFYTTEVKRAKKLAQFLHQEGFTRVGCFHGETPSSQRRELLQKWRENSLDVMVATSAFGLGVDKSDVRTIVHACLPENLHRYYQEVGRGGRDGNSAVCILIPSNRDIKIAENLAPKYLTEERLQERWDVMWRTAEEVNAVEHIWKVNLYARRDELLGKPPSDENIRWNKRLLLQLLRAGKVKLIDFNYVTSEDDLPESEWATLKVKFPASDGEIGANISVQRTDEIQKSSEGIEQMKNCLNAEKPICLILRKLYNVETKRICGGCPACRRSGRIFDECPSLEYNIPVVTQPKHQVIANFLNPLSNKNKMDFKRLLRTIVEQKKIFRFACERKYFDRLISIFNDIFRKVDTQLFRLDALKQSEILYLLPDESLGFFHFDNLNSQALNLSEGKEILHFIMPDVNYRDYAGKYPGESDGWRFFSNPDQWI